MPTISSFAVIPLLQDIDFLQIGKLIAQYGTSVVIFTFLNDLFFYVQSNPKKSRVILTRGIQNSIRDAF